MRARWMNSLQMRNDHQQEDIRRVNLYPLPHSRLAFLFALIAFHIEQLSEMINPWTLIQCSWTWAASVTSRSICDSKRGTVSNESIAEKAAHKGALPVGSGSPVLSFHSASSRLLSAIQTPLPSGRWPASRLAALTPDSHEQSRGRALDQDQLLECTEPVLGFVPSQGWWSAPSHAHCPILKGFNQQIINS